MSTDNNPRKGKKIVIPGPAQPQPVAQPTMAAAPAYPGTPESAAQQQAALTEIARLGQQQQGANPQGVPFDFSKVHLHLGIQIGRAHV